MATNFGSDTSCVTDLPRIDLQVTSPQKLIGQRIARRLQTPRGALAAIGDDANFGWDVRQYANGRLGPTTIATAESQIEAECTKDEQVQSASVKITPGTGGALTITVQLVSAAGPFTLTLSVDDLTVGAIFGA